MGLTFRRLLAMLGAAVLAGCAAVDQFGDRATVYNLEAEKARTQGLLLNVLRSAFRKPLQFIDVPTISGQGSASGGLGSLLPLAGPASTYQLNPTATLSGGPTFNVTVLDTKEFYSAILAPLPMQTMSYYIGVGYPRKLLFTLFFQRVAITGFGDDRPLGDNVRRQGDFERFQALLDDLVNAGLTTEPVTETQKIGPPLPARPRSVEDIVKLQKEGLDVTGPGHGAGYQVFRNQQIFAFCFDRHLAGGASRLSPAFIHDHRCGRPKDERPTQAASLKITPRSTEGIIYFLGEIARVELGLSGEPAYTPKIRVREDEEDTLFALRRESADPSLTVAYGGAPYSIAADPRNRDHSGQVLDLVLQLLALNSSAKDLPAPNIITIPGR